MMKLNPKNPKICLTIAGLDPSGGAGIIADVKTFSAFGCFATAAAASLTFQNTVGVFGSVAQTADAVRRQIQPVVEDFEIAAVKTGMLPTKEIVETVARIIEKNGLPNLVVDPVMRSTSGFDLIDEDALRALIENLFPLAAVVTPNLPEAERITNRKIETAADIEQAARLIQSRGARNVLIKGGHNPIFDFRFSIFDSDGETKNQEPKTKIRIARDYLFAGNDLKIYEAEFIETGTATHGTGCTLAAAIAANLALGKSLFEAVGAAKRFVTEAIQNAPRIGRGDSPVGIK